MLGSRLSAESAGAEMQSEHTGASHAPFYFIKQHNTDHVTKRVLK